MKILVLSCYDDNYLSCGLGQASENKNKTYCDNHGYDFKCINIETRKDIKDDLYYFFWKFKLILENIEEYDYIFWIDADAFIVKHDVKLEDIIDTNMDMQICIDINYMNTGVFITKCGEFSEKMFNDILEQGPKTKHDFPDAFIMKRYYDNNTDKFKIMEQWFFNSYVHSLYNLNYPKGEYRENESFIIHFPGMPYQKRINIAKNMGIV